MQLNRLVIVMFADLLEATVLNNTRYEKNPKRCLDYHIFDHNRVPLTQEQIAVEWAASGKGEETQSLRVRKSPIRICAGGDSWINILIEVSRFLGYNKTFFDILEGYYQTVSTAWPGHTVDRIVKEKPFKIYIDGGRFDYFIFSGGGSEFLGGSALTRLLKAKETCAEQVHPEQLLDTDRLEATMERLKDGYLEIAEYVRSKCPLTQVLVHGYDYPVAHAAGPWFGKPFLKRNYDFETDREMIAGVLKYLVDRFYAVLDEVELQSPNVVVVDIRNMVRGRWTDELHPDLEASKDIAAFYRNVIDGFPTV
jgi:hypothetical protein